MHTKNFDPYDFSKKEIDGVNVYYKNLPWAPCIHIRVVFNVGAFDDPIGKEGLSHFLEHMFFDGSPSLPDKKAVKNWQKKYTLNTANAATSYFKVAFTAKTLPEDFENVLGGIKDLLFNPFIRSEDVEHERQVITQEAWGRYQNEKYLNYLKEFLANNYHGHVHERSIRALGWPETIAKITKEDLSDWHKKNCVKNNFFIIMAGAVEEKHLTVLGDYFKDIPNGELSKKIINEFNPPKSLRFVKNADDIGLVREQVSFLLSRFSEKIPYLYEGVLSLSMGLLGDMLNEKLRIDNSLCYSVNTSFYNIMGFFEVWVQVKTSKEKLDITEKEIWNVITGIISGEYKERFEDIKTLSLQRLKSGEFLSGEVADYALDEVIQNGGNITTLREMIGLTEKVTYDDVANIIKKIFDKDWVFTEIILPSKKE